jgi:hypothetical protein
MALSTGAKVAIGCGCLVMLGGAAVLGVVGAGAWWAKGKMEEVGVGIGEMTAQAEESERYEKQANASPYSPKPDGVIAEDRLLKFIEVRRQVHAVYQTYESQLKDIEKKAESSNEKLTLSEVWTAGGALAKMAGDIRLAQMKGLAAVGMNVQEYAEIQMAVYKSAWASESQSKSGQLPAEAISGAMAEAAKQMPKGTLSEEDARKLEEEVKKASEQAGQTLHVPRENVELFRKHEADLRKYAMSGLAFIGL